jgi:hypothetical protein
MELFTVFSLFLIFISIITRNYASFEQDERRFGTLEKLVEQIEGTYLHFLEIRLHYKDYIRSQSFICPPAVNRHYPLRRFLCLNH